jgi:hypothetical protein
MRGALASRPELLTGARRLPSTGDGSTSARFRQFTIDCGGPMAMAKSEMEMHVAAYRARAADARTAVAADQFQDAISVAVSSLQHVEGVIRYDRKYAQTGPPTPLDAVDVILEYAPLFFRSDCLEAIEALQKRSGRVLRDSLPGLSSRTCAARAVLLCACRLLSALASDHDHKVDHQAPSESDRLAWQKILPVWERASFVRRVTHDGHHRLVLVTRMNETVFAKCPSCGAVGKAAKAKCLEELGCPRCHARVHFVVLTRDV